MANVDGIGHSRRPEHPDDTNLDSKRESGGARALPTRRPVSVGLTMLRPFTDNPSPSAMPPPGYGMRPMFNPHTLLNLPSKRDAVRSYPAADGPVKRLPAASAQEFGIGATRWAPEAADSTALKTRAINILPPFVPGPGVYVGATTQVAHFPATPEHPNGMELKRQTGFVEIRGVRSHRSAETVPGVKLKTSERIRWHDPGFKVPVWERIMEKLINLFSH